MTTVADDHTRQRISRLDLDQTLFVEAGAGTGKTTQLVDRVVNLVLEAGVRLADVAAITFTEAAAAELQDRIRVRFEEIAGEAADPDVRRRCEEAVKDADLAAISTLHGFAKRILAEHPVGVGLPPRIDIADEVSSQLAHEARWERFVDALFDAPEHEALLVRATLLDLELEPRYPGHATLKDVASRLAQSWDRLEPLLQQPERPLPPVDFGPFDAAVDQLAIVAKQCTDPSDLLYDRITELLPQLAAIVELDDPDRKLRALVRSSAWKPGRGGRGAAWSCPVKEAKDALAAVNEGRDEVVASASEEVLQQLLRIVAAEVLEAAEARRAEGHLEFHDLLVLAQRLLRTSPDARRALHRRYRRLLLDEFQDTDPIQIELAVLIASAVEDPGHAGWAHVPVDAGRLFFVGDPKQSIYRFRRADISLFLEARDVFSPDDSWLRLVTNFRTVPEVVEWNNQLFGQLMAHGREGSQPRYEPLVAHRRSDSGADHRPVLLGGPAAVKLRAPELRQAEAADVARTIDDVRRHPERWPVLDPAAGGWRPARLPDVTVLVPTRTSLPFLRDALAQREIPYRLDTGTLVYSTQEVRDALAALRAVDDPTDELSVVAALRSPLYACSDPELLAWRQAGGRWDPRPPAPHDLAGHHPVAGAMAHLRSLWERRWWDGPSDLLDRLLTERGAHLLAFGQGRPAEVWRRLRFLVDQARSFEEAGGSTLRGFLDWADLQSSEGSRVHEPLLPETDDEAVRILTVHGSKGLEFPITILSGLTTQPGRGRQGVSLVWDDDGLPQVELRKGAATGGHDPRADLEAGMDEDEKLRLLYVACTRARDHLVVSCHHNAGDRTYANRVWDLCAERDDTWRPLPVEPVAEPLTLPFAPTAATPPTAAGVADDDRVAWLAARTALLERQREPRVVSATAVARRAAEADEAAEAAELADRDGDPGDDGAGGERPVPARRRGRAGTAIGRAVHATLQLVDLAAPVHLDQQAARQAELEGVPGAAATVAAMARSALGADAVRRAARAPAHHKEVYVAAPVGDRTIEGYIDLLVEDGDGLVVVDYKTDGVRSEAEVQRKLAAYELQGAAYAVALEAATGLVVRECRFVFCRPGGAIERSVADLPGAMARVRRQLGADPG